MGAVQMRLPECLMTPVGARDYVDKLAFLHDEDRFPGLKQLRALGVRIGAQFVGKLTDEMREAYRDVPVAIHAPNGLIDQLYREDAEGGNWAGLLDDKVSGWVKFRPENTELNRFFYLVLHGGSVGWTPSDEMLDQGRVFYRKTTHIPSYALRAGVKLESLPTETTEAMLPRYRWPAEVTLDRYLEAVKFTTIVFGKLLGFEGLNPLLENTSITNFYKGLMLPTHLDPRVGVWVNDMRWFSDRMCWGLLCDIEHITFSWNFLNRRACYEDLSCESHLPITRTLEHFGWDFAPGYIPWATENFSTVEDAIRAMGAHHFHVAGSTREWMSCYRIDTAGGEGGQYRITSHYPIMRLDTSFCSKLRAVLECEPITICTEVAGKSDIENDPFSDRWPELEVQAESWQVLHEYLLALHKEGALPPN